jgi:hypothetical protein
MKPGRAFSLLAGVALLGGIAKFNEMTPAAQAALLDAARETAVSWVRGALVTYDQLTGTAAAQQPPAAARQAVAPQAAAPPQGAAGKDGDGPRRVAARGAEPEPPSTGNPLWSLPLKQLSMTRERPIFSPSRRPPPPPAPAFVAPVAVRTPVKPPEPQRPTVSLLGTIIGAEDQIGVFLDSATQSIVRLRVGEHHQGWVLRIIKAREVTLVKNDEQPVVLELAAPGGGPLPGLPGTPGNFPGVPSVGAPNPALNLPPNYQVPGVTVPGLPPGAQAGVPGGATAGNQRNRRQQQQH